MLGQRKLLAGGRDVASVFRSVKIVFLLEVSLYRKQYDNQLL